MDGGLEQVFRVGTDIDEVLADLNKEVRYYWERVHGRIRTREDFHTTNFWEVYGVPKEQMFQEFWDFVQHDGGHHFRNASVIEGSREAIAAISQYLHIEAITARSELDRVNTEFFLRNAYGENISDVHFTNGFCKVHPRRDKSEICLDRMMIAFVEDNHKYAIDISSIIKGPIYLIKTPWNEKHLTDLPQNIIPVEGWSQIQSEFLNWLYHNENCLEQYLRR